MSEEKVMNPAAEAEEEEERLHEQVKVRRDKLAALCEAGKNPYEITKYDWDTKNQEIRDIQLIVNRVRMDMVRRGDMMSVDDVMDILSVPVIGTVPDDEDIVISTNQGEPLVGMNGYAGQAYLNICKRILGESVPFIQLDASPGFWSRISGFLKRA